MKTCRFLHNTVLTVGVCLLTLLATDSHSQDYQRNKKRFYKANYTKGASSVERACRTLQKNMSNTKNRYVPKGGSWQAYRPQVEVEQRPVAMASTKSVSAPKPTLSAPVMKPAPTLTSNGKPTFTPSPIVSKTTLDQLHNREDEVLKLNHLPTPSSEKHEEIRRLVANTLAKKTDGEPIELEPLYFTFDKDEFAIVDMDPFLIAVEFALQGKHILIEGHTDHQGNDDYNVQLSIKRVQKIRQLMLDMGVSDDHISVVGYGEEVTDHTDQTEQGKQQNRRVDFRAF